MIVAFPLYKVSLKIRSFCLLNSISHNSVWGMVAFRHSGIPAFQVFFDKEYGGIPAFRGFLMWHFSVDEDAMCRIEGVVDGIMVECSFCLSEVG